MTEIVSDSESPAIPSPTAKVHRGVAGLARRRPGRPPALRVPPAGRSSRTNYYFYIRDPDWGPSFIKTTAYAPFSVWIYLNGNEWAKQQAAERGIAFTALDNGFAACQDPVALAEICGRLSSADVWAFFERWQARLPTPPS